QPIEEALASLGSAGSASIPSRSTGSQSSRSTGLQPVSPVTPASAPTPNGPAGLRSRLHAALVDAQKMFVADALEHAEAAESGNELVITPAKVYAMSLKDPAVDAAVRTVLGRPIKITMKLTEAAAPVIASKPAPASVTSNNDEVNQRALSHPEV